MSRIANIQLQNDDRSHCRFILPSELADMEKREEVMVFTRRTGNKVLTIARLKPKVEALRTMKEASKPTITYADVLANVGLTDRPNSTLELSPGRQVAARAKIAEYERQHRRCTWYGTSTPQEGFDLHTMVALSVNDEVLAFDYTSEPPVERDAFDAPLDLIEA